MWQVFGKDFKQFFGSVAGYVVMIVFAVVAGLFFWYLEGEYNLMFSGFADPSPMFELIPWLAIFILPAISMRSFSEEYRTGTVELLLTKPVSVPSLVTGKFLAVWLIGLLMMWPLGMYVWHLHRLMLPGEQADTGILIAAFTGLILLTGIFAAVGVWISSLTVSQTGAYLGGVFLLFLLYYGFYGLASFQWVGGADYAIRKLSLIEVYRRFVSGVVEWRLLAYMIFWLTLFLFLTIQRLSKKRG